MAAKDETVSGGHSVQDLPGSRGEVDFPFVGVLVDVFGDSQNPRAPGVVLRDSEAIESAVAEPQFKLQGKAGANGELVNPGSFRLLGK